MLVIEKCDGLYKYFDADFMGRDGGCTYSRTPPDKEVEFVVEAFTIRKIGAFSNGRTVSRGRKIPRHKVTPLRHTPGDYLETPDGRVFGENYYYHPPSTASLWEKREYRKLKKSTSK